MRGTARSKRNLVLQTKSYPRPEYIGTMVMITEPRRPVDTLELFPLNCMESAEMRRNERPSRCAIWSHQRNGHKEGGSLSFS